MILIDLTVKNKDSNPFPTGKPHNPSIQNTCITYMDFCFQYDSVPVRVTLSAHMATMLQWTHTT